MSSKKSIKKTCIWLADENRKSLVQVRISGVNMQGTGFTGFIFKKETFISKYTIECTLLNRQWTVCRSFDEFAELFISIHNNPFISVRKKLVVSIILYN